MSFRMMPFFDIPISQGSVATCLRRGGIFKHGFVANILLSPLVKKIWKSDIVGEVMAKSLVSCFFDSRCSFCSVAWQLARFQLTRRIARSLGDSWASCCSVTSYSHLVRLWLQYILYYFVRVFCVFFSFVVDYVCFSRLIAHNFLILSFVPSLWAVVGAL